MLTKDDEELEAALVEAVRRERESVVVVLTRLMPFDEAGVWRKRGHATLYRYCLDKLGYTPGQASRRIQAMRLANRFPEVIDALRVGQTSLEAITALAPILNKSNIVEMMSAACGKTALEVQALVAGPGKNVRVTLHLSPTVLTAVERVKGLIWHRKPTAKIEDVFEEAVEFYLDKCDPERKTIRQAATSRQPAPGRSLEPNRRIPQAIKDEVWHRDGGRCAYLKPDGSRCVEQKGLEYDHIVPFALGGPSNRVQNIRLLCWGHNQMEMRRRFGARA